MKKFLIFVLIIFLGSIVIVKATPPLRDPEHLDNYELIIESNNDVSIIEEMITIDLRESEETPFPKASVHAEYKLNKSSDTKTVKIALPIVGTPDEVMKFRLDEIILNDKAIVPKFYIGDLWLYNWEDFKEQMESATPLDYNFPADITGTLYTINYEPIKSQFNVSIKNTNNSKIISENNFYHSDGEIFLTLWGGDPDKEYSFFVIGEKVNPEASVSGVAFEKEEITLKQYFNDYLKDDNNENLFNQIMKHNIKSFLDSDSPLLNYWSLVRMERRTFLYIFEAEILGNEVENNLELNYQMFGANDTNYEPDLYKFRYFFYTSESWSSYENLKINIYPPKFAPHLIYDDYNLIEAGDHYESFSPTVLRDVLQFSFSSDPNPQLRRSGFIDFLFIIMILVFVAPIVVIILVAVILFITEKKKERMYKEKRFTRY
jgi:hypothetical protein